MEKLAIAAPEEFAVQVVKSLIAYIKGHAQLTAILKTEGGKNTFGNESLCRMLGEDVKTTFAALHNILSDKMIKAMIDNAILDFSHQDFSGLNLSGEQVNLSHYKNWAGANFKSSLLFSADFKGANLLFAEFGGANLGYADLRGALYDKGGLVGAYDYEIKTDDN